MRKLIALALLCLSFVTSAVALTKEHASQRSRILMHALLTGDSDTASTLTESDVTPWIAVLDKRFPSSDGEQIRYEIMDAAGSMAHRRCVVRVERKQVKELYYVEFDGPEIVAFHTVRDLLGLHQENIEAKSEEFFKLLTDWRSGDLEAAGSVIRASGDYTSSVERLREELQWYIKWLRNNDAPEGKAPSQGS